MRVFVGVLIVCVCICVALFMKCFILSNKLKQAMSIEFSFNFIYCCFFVILRFFVTLFRFPRPPPASNSIGNTPNLVLDFGIRNFFLLFSFVSVQFFCILFFFLSRSLALVVRWLRLKVGINVNYAFYCQKDY